jgi:hypothetical protein
MNKVVGFVVLTAVVIFCDITVQSAGSQPTFRRNMSSHSGSKKKPSSACHVLSCWFLAWLILTSWRWRWHIPPKCRSTFDGLHGVVTQKIELFRLMRWSQFGNITLQVDPHITSLVNTDLQRPKCDEFISSPIPWPIYRLRTMKPLCAGNLCFHWDAANLSKWPTYT